jgi:hypothetical protein
MNFIMCQYKIPSVLLISFIQNSRKLNQSALRVTGRKFCIFVVFTFQTEIERFTTSFYIHNYFVFIVPSIIDIHKYKDVQSKLVITLTRMERGRDILLPLH